MYKYLVLTIAVCLIAIFAVSSVSASPVEAPVSLAPARQGSSGPSIVPFGANFHAVDVLNPAIKPLAQDAGVRWFNPWQSWSSQEPAPGNYVWTYDSYFANATAAGFTPIVMVGGAPADTLLDPSKPYGPIKPEAYQRFADFMGAMAAHYSQPPYNVHYWTLMFYNSELEKYSPGSDTGWGCYWKEYADLLKVVWPAVHAADPNGKVVLGPLAYDWYNTSTYTFIQDQAQCLSRTDSWFNLYFLDGVIANGGAPYIDAVNFNYYSVLVNFPPAHPWATTGVAGKAQALLDKFPVDQRDKEFLISEMGYPRASPFTLTPPASAETAARSIAQTYAQIFGAQDSGVRIIGALVFTFDHLVDQVGVTWGLLNPDGSPRWPEYYAYKTMTHELEGAVYQGKYTNPSAPTVEGYTFTIPGGTKTVLWNTPWYTNSPVTVTFAGTGLRIVDKVGNPVTGTEVGGQTQVQVTGSPIYVGPLPVVQSCDPWDIAAPSGTVDIADLMDIANYWHATTFDPKYDFNGDSEIDIRDVMEVAAHMGPCV